MKISFKLKYDEEYGEYYFQPFKNNDDYVWENDILPDDKNQLWAITEYGDIRVDKIDYDNMKVICIVNK